VGLAGVGGDGRVSVAADLRDDSGDSGASSFESGPSSGEESSNESVMDGFSAEVCDRARERVQESCPPTSGREAEYGTDVRESRKRKGRRVTGVGNQEDF